MTTVKLGRGGGRGRGVPACISFLFKTKPKTFIDVPSADFTSYFIGQNWFHGLTAAREAGKVGNGLVVTDLDSL